MDSVDKVGGGSFWTEFGALGPHISSAEVGDFMADTCILPLLTPYRLLLIN